MTSTDPFSPTGALRIRDVTLRDGLQDERTVHTHTKVVVFDALVTAGVTELELTSFVRADRVPAMADAEALVHATGSSCDHGPARWGLVLNRRGAERALGAGLRHLQYVVSASESHSHANTGADVSTCVTHLRDVVELAAAAGATVEVTVATAFGCPSEGAVRPGEVIRLVERCLDAGVSAIALADTIGTATPGEVRRLIGSVVTVSPEVGVHLHDTRGLALVNAFAAIDAGVARLDASLGGLGGCPFAPGASGNLPTEDLVHALHESGATTGIDLDGVLAAARLACAAVGRDVDSHVGRAGARFARATV